jgi:hypothetical protein
MRVLWLSVDQHMSIFNNDFTLPVFERFPFVSDHLSYHVITGDEHGFEVILM